jgi:hypothetical protein
MQNTLAISEARKQSPCVLTLWEIVNTLNAIKFSETWKSLQSIKLAVDEAAKNDPANLLTEGYFSAIENLTKELREICEGLALGRAFDAMVNLDCRLFDGLPWLSRDASMLLWDVDEKTRGELHSMIFVQIPPDKAQFFEQDALFGPAVQNAASMELNAEIRAAGNCLAADLNTAAVFHLMRVVEHGARSLAARLDVALSKKQISQSEWQTLIQAMEVRISRSQRHKKPIPLKPGELKLFRGAIMDIKSFKDLWRNDVMHTRGNYKFHDAKNVKEYVEHFMRGLVGHVPLK